MGQETLNIPLKYIGALLYMSCRKPTRQELNEGQIFDLTDYRVWILRQDKTDDTEDHEMFPDNIIYCKARTNPELPDMNQLISCLGWKPDDVINNTWKNTTQFASNISRLPMRMHFKSREPAMHAKQLREIFATDTFFLSEKALGGYICAQLYVGKESTFTEIYGMKTKNQMPQTLQDFIRQ